MNAASLPSKPLSTSTPAGSPGGFPRPASGGSTSQRERDTAACAPSKVEQALVGALLDDQHGTRVYDLARRHGITTASFADPASAAVWRAAERVHAAHNAVAFALIDGELHTSGDWEKIGGMTLVETITTAADPYHVEALVAQLAAAHRQRKGEILSEAFLTGDCDITATAASWALLAEQHGDTGLSPVDAASLARTEPPPPDAILEGLFDTGDKVPLIACSKSRKSFFVLMMALLVAAGRGQFLGWRIPKRRRVLLLQMEIKKAHFQGRVYRLTKALGIAPDELTDWLWIVNARGQTVTPDGIITLAKSVRAEFVILDPLYKLLQGDENAAADMKPVLAAFDRLVETTGAAVLYPHHNGKGFAGDRDARDRGAGSGVLARDFDAAIYLTDHAADEDLIVLSSLSRNYAQSAPATITWNDGRFELTDDEPIEKTSRNRNAAPTRPDVAELIPAAVALAKVKPIGIGRFRAQLYKLAKTQTRTRELYAELIGDGHLIEFHERGRGYHTALIGTPDQIKQLKQRTFAE